MNASVYRRIERHMLLCMQDSAHDRDHVYRVLHVAMDIAAHEPAANLDVLAAACLLHDIGRAEQFADPRLDHARVGAGKARGFLLGEGFDEGFVRAVCDAIRTHRYRSDDPPVSLEARILFDADKVDAAGALGVARTLLYQGYAGAPLYTLDGGGAVRDGTGEEPPSFLREVHFKLERLYDRFYTARGAEIAAQRRQAARDFASALLREARASHDPGRALLNQFLTRED